MTDSLPINSIISCTRAKSFQEVSELRRLKGL